MTDPCLVLESNHTFGDRQIGHAVSRLDKQLGIGSSSGEQPLVRSKSHLSGIGEKDGSNISGAQSATYTIQSTSAGNNGAQFSFYVSNGCGNAISASGTLTVNTAPVITTQPSNLEVCEMRSGSFSIAATGTAPLTYQWRRNGTSLPGATASSYSSVWDDDENGSIFTCTVRNAVDSVVSEPAILTVKRWPYFTTHPSSQTVMAGDTVTFTAVAGGALPLTYHWVKNGDSLPNTGSATYRFVATASDNGASIVCNAENSCEDTYSQAAILTVNVPVPPTITTQPSSQIVMEGSSATFTIGRRS